MKLTERLLVSDLDGTLILNGKISEKNINAINRFRQLGGSFTVATGRSPAQARYYMDLLGIRETLICNDGAMLYHSGRQEPIWFAAFPQDYPPVIEQIKRDFPETGILLIDSKDQYYLVKNHPLVDAFADYCLLDKKSFIPDRFPLQDCCKGMIVGKNSDILALNAYLQACNPGFGFFPAGDDLIDLVPKAVDKGTPLQRLAESYQIPFSGVVAVGDFCNDIAMLQKAPLGVAVGNALPEVKAAADLIVAPCSEDAIADLIDRLIQDSDIN